VLTPWIARRNGDVDTRMVLGRYGHMFEGARRQEAETMDRVFETAEIGRQIGIKKTGCSSEKSNTDSKRPYEIGERLEEMGDPNRRSFSRYPAEA
jgi:hypothetical protein